jgi:hypothetical protein
MSDIKILSTPKEVLQQIDQRMAEDRFAHIQVKAYENKGVFERWVAQARVWYDPNVCGCKKKGMSDDVILNQYKAFKTLSEEEKSKAYRIIGVPVELRHEGEVIVKIP